MKRIIIMLLITCSAITNMSADPTAAPQKKPANVIATLNAIIQKFGMNEGQVYSVSRNPNTGIMESSTKIVPFTCPANDMKNDNVLKAVALNFQKEEPLSYQFQHLQPGSNENVYLMVIDNDGKGKNVCIRPNNRQEMWLMCTKNPENPQLRDAYAVTWKLSEDKQKAVGTVYMITSLRPDIYVKNLETSKKTFKIEGRVDANIKDSLYNIYIANTAEELERIGDDDYVACVPVINKRFEWQTELDKPCVGRLRCIFPDGELCSAWINLDFVPGETYRITVHNGYYDEDQDYERRVGRNSGKSLLNQRQSLGIDDIASVADVIDTIPDYNEPASQSSNLEWKPTPGQKMQIEAKGMAIKANMDVIKATYASLEPYFKMKSLTGTDRIFAQITKLNKGLDAKFQDFFKYLNGLDVPPAEKAEKTKAFGELYKEILKFYTEQNQGFTEMCKEVGVLTKAAQKTQKYINKLTEKYMNEMSKYL